MSVPGTSRKWLGEPMTSAIRGTADSLCSLRAFPSLTDTVIHQRRLTPLCGGHALPPRCRMTASLRATATLALRSALREDVGCHCNLYRHDDCRDFSVVSGLDRLCVSADLFGLGVASQPHRQTIWVRAERKSQSRRRVPSFYLVDEFNLPSHG